MNDRFDEQGNRIERRSGHAHIWTGLFILLVGVAAMVKVSNPALPDWIFSWQMFLIALGLFIGLRHNFKGGAWFIMILVGGTFLFAEIYPDISIRRYIWPIVLMAVGALLIFRPRNRSRQYCEDWKKKSTAPGITPEATTGGDPYAVPDDYVDSTSFFGGAKKNIISKNFRGGDLVNIFGGTELDLSRADLNGTAVLELTTIFGGTKLIVPSNWTVRSEAVTIFGGMEDKRNMHNVTDDPSKVLVIQGTIIFGGIELKSF